MNNENENDEDGIKKSTSYTKNSFVYKIIISNKSKKMIEVDSLVAFASSKHKHVDSRRNGAKPQKTAQLLLSSYPS